MEGVTILHQFEVVTETVFSWPACWVGVLAGIGIALVIGIIFGVQEHDWFAFLLMFGVSSVLLSILNGFLFGEVISPATAASETHYEVFSTEEVNLKEFMEKYEILETRGSIYTVREKSND